MCSEMSIIDKLKTHSGHIFKAPTVNLWSNIKDMGGTVEVGRQKER